MVKLWLLALLVILVSEANENIRGSLCLDDMGDCDFDYCGNGNFMPYMMKFCKRTCGVCCGNTMPFVVLSPVLDS